MMTAANTPTEKLPTIPRTAAFHAAEAQLHKLYRALQAAGDSPESEALYKEYEAADAERDAAFAAWRDSDEPRVYSLGDGGSDCTITCSPSKLEESVINAWSDAFEPEDTSWRPISPDKKKPMTVITTLTVQMISYEVTAVE